MLDFCAHLIYVRSRDTGLDQRCTLGFLLGVFRYRAVGLAGVATAVSSRGRTPPALSAPLDWRLR